MQFFILTTPATATDQSSSVNRSRRNPDPRQGSATGKRVLTPMFVLIGILILIGGMLLGAFVERRRHRQPEIVVAVNGMTIDKPTFTNRLENVAGDQTIHQLVGDELQLQFARMQGVAPTDAEVATRYAADSKRPDFQQQLQRHHQNPAMYKRSLQVELAKTALLTQGVHVTDEQIRAFYKEQSNPRNLTARYYRPEAIKIAVVITAQEAQAQQAIKALHDGVPFAEVAQHYSQDQSKVNGGAMPAFARGRTASSRIPGLEEALFSLNIGQQLGPRRFANAWWIVKCLDKSPEQTVPYEQVKEDCRQGALLEQGARQNAKKLSAEFNDFQHHAIIQAFMPEYEDAVSVK